MTPHESKDPVPGSYVNESYEVDETKSVSGPGPDSNAYQELKDTFANSRQVSFVSNPPVILDSSNKCGWFAIRPDFLQRFNNAKGYLFFICLFALAKGMGAQGLVYVTLTTLEQRFHLRSTQSALITSTFEISVVVSILIVTYFGEKSHKPRILGVEALIFGVGSVVFTLPHFLSGNYEPHLDYDDKTCNVNQTLVMSGGGGGTGYCGDDGAMEYFWILYVAQILHGIGAAGLYTLNKVYLDENVKQTTVAAYLGTVEAVMMVSPAIGYVLGAGFLFIYTDVHIDPSSIGLTPDSELWIGNWWLPFYIPAAICLLIFIPILGFPRRLPEFTRHFTRRKSQSQRGSAYKPPSGWHKKAIDFPHATWNLIKNVPYMFLNISVTAEKFVLYGIYVFGPKYLESQFSLTTAGAAGILGAIEIPAALIGCTFSGWLIRKKKLDFGGQLKMTKVAIVIAMISFFAFFITCPNEHFAGVNVMYKDPNQTCKGDEHGADLIATCNEHCSCSGGYDPVCGSNDIMYYSPCHAGCDDQMQQDEKATSGWFSIFAEANGGSEWYANCSCIKQKGPEPSTAVAGKCPADCAGLGGFLLVMFIIFLSFSMSAVPHYTMILSCVGMSQRAYAVGLHSIIYRLLGTIPGPIVFGALIDKTCLIWDESCEGGGSPCLMYDNSLMGIYFFVLCFTFKSIALLFSFGAMCWYKQEEVDEMDMSEIKVNTEKNDFIEIKEAKDIYSNEITDKTETIDINSNVVNADSSSESELVGEKEAMEIISSGVNGSVRSESEFTDAMDAMKMNSNILNGDTINKSDVTDKIEAMEMDLGGVNEDAKSESGATDIKEIVVNNSTGLNVDNISQSEVVDKKEDIKIISSDENLAAIPESGVTDIKEAIETTQSGLN